MVQAEPNLKISTDGVLGYMDPFLVYITEMLKAGSRHLEVLAYLQKVGETAIDPYPDTPPEEQQTYCRLAGWRALNGLSTPRDRALTVLFMLRMLDLHMFGMLPFNVIEYIQAGLSRDTMEFGDAGSNKKSPRYKFVVTYEMFVGVMMQKVVRPELYDYLLALLDTIEPALEGGAEGAAAPEGGPEGAEELAYGGVAPGKFMVPEPDGSAMEAAAGLEHNPSDVVYEDDELLNKLGMDTLVALTPLWSAKKWMRMKEAMTPADRLNPTKQLGDAIRSHFDPAIQYEVVRTFHSAAVRGDPELYAHAGITAEQDVEDWVNATGDPWIRMYRRAMINDMETLGDQWTLTLVYGEIEKGALMYYHLITHAIDKIEARGTLDDAGPVGTLSRELTLDDESVHETETEERRVGETETEEQRVGETETEERRVAKNAIRIVMNVMPQAGRFSFSETLAMAFEQLVLQFFELRSMDRLKHVRMSRRTLAIAKAVITFLITTITKGWRAGVVEAHVVDDMLPPHRGAADLNPDSDTDNDHLLSDLVVDAQEMLHVVPRGAAAKRVCPHGRKAKLAEQHRLLNIAEEEGDERLLQKRANLLEHLSTINAREPGALTEATRSVMLDKLAVLWKEYQTAAVQHARMPSTRARTARMISFTRCWLPRCDAVAMWICIGCGMAMYDSEQSQREDWVRHKPECRLIRTKDK